MYVLLVTQNLACRYLAEIDRQEDEDEAAACYQTATEEAAKLDKTDAVRLGLALNYSGTRAYPNAACHIKVSLCAASHIRAHSVPL